MEDLATVNGASLLQHCTHIHIIIIYVCTYVHVYVLIGPTCATSIYIHVMYTNSLTYMNVCTVYCVRLHGEICTLPCVAVVFCDSKPQNV